MTRVAVFSDTHGLLVRLPAAMARLGSVDAFVHLGDFASDAADIARALCVPYTAVRGNCDYGERRTPRECVAEYGGARLLLTHGDAYASTYALACRAEERRCAAALFGHTHTPLLTAQGALLIINPDSLSQPRYGSAPSCALLTIEHGDVDVRMLSL